jgi:hypothetical protein
LFAPGGWALLEPGNAHVVVSVPLLREQPVSDYRAYLIGDIDGHRFIKADFSSDYPDDATAISAAKELINGHDVELWDRGRFVARLPSEAK